MKERILIVFIAGILGILITTAGFFIYQSAKALPEDTKEKKGPKSSLPDFKPQSKDKSPFTISDPKEEAVVNKRSVEVKGKTDPTATIVVSSNQEDVLATPNMNGEFSATITIDTGVNPLNIQVIMPDGSTYSEVRTVTYSSEEF